MTKTRKYQSKIRFLISPILTWAFLSTAHGGEITYTFDNSLGSADYLLGSLLLSDASYSSSAFTLSSVLSDNSRAYLDISHTQIHPQSEFSNSGGELGLQLRYLDLQDSQVFAGLFAFINLYHDTYSYYNSNGFGMYLKWKYYLRATQLFIAGYDLNFNRFEEVTEASNTDQEIYLTYNQSFASKTSINLRTALAYQNFWSQTVYLNQSPGRFQTAVEVDSIPDNYLLETEFRLSQTLGPKLGGTLWFNYRMIVQDNTSMLAIQDGLNNPFIDRFRSEGSSVSMRLLYRINADQRMKLTLFNDVKNFRAVPVYEFDFDNMSYVIENDAYIDLGIDRSDERFKAQVTWSIFLGQPDFELFSDIELLINAGWTKSSSNDPLYDYESKHYGISLNINN